MKKRVTLLLVVALSLMHALPVMAQNDAIERFFGKYMDDERFTVVSVSPRMFKMFSKVNWDDVPSDVKDVVSDLTSLRILTTEVTPELFYKEARQKINIKEYEELMTIRDAGTDVRFLIRQSGNVIQELLMLVGSKDEFLLMSFTGRIDLDKISKLGQTLNIEGMDKLKDVKKKKG